MKRLTFLAAALASLFLAGSCQQENLEPVAQGTTVKFQVEVPGGIDTRTVADGLNVDVLYYAIYKDGDGNEKHVNGVHYTESDATPLASGYVEGGNRKFNITFDLLVDQKYVAIFWAQVGAEKQYYTWPNNDDLRLISYAEPSVLGNREDRAAFFRTFQFDTYEVQDHDVTLYRPFAQLNLGTTLESLQPTQGASEQSGTTVETKDYVIDVLESEVKVTGLSRTFNTIAGLGNEGYCGQAEDCFDKPYTFTMYNVITTGTITDGHDGREYLYVTNKKGDEVPYEYIAMNYFFANGNVTVEYDIKTDKGTVNNTIENVPVMENFRTNIIGNLLTSKTDFEITVDERFVNPTTGQLNPDENLHMIFDEYQLQAALDAAKPGDNTFYLGGNIVGNVTITQKEGVNIVIDGTKCGAEVGPKFDGTITINGDARANGGEKLTIRGINFESETAKTFIDAPTKIDGRYNYSHNVTVEKCTFSSPKFNEEIVGIKLQTTYNASIIGCSAKNIHTLAQFYSTDNKTVIKDVKVENCKNGIALGNIANATITNAHISANGYGVRLDGEPTRAVAVTITDSKIEAYIPVNVRKMNNDACNATVKFQGENTLAGDSYEVAFCSNEYEDGVAPVAPKGTFTLENAEKWEVYYGDSGVNTVSAFVAAINSNDGDVIVKNNIESVGLGHEVKRDVLIDFDDKVFNAGSTASSTWYALEINGDHNVSIVNANFTRAGIYAAAGADVVFNNGIINHKPERSSRYIFCAQSGSTITIKEGTFNNDRENNAYFWADNATIYVEGGTFAGVKSKKNVVLSNGGQLIISGGTFNFDPTPWVAENYVANKVGNNNWKVVPAETVEIEGVVYTSVNDTETFTAALNGKTQNIVLFPGTYEGTFAIKADNTTILGLEGAVVACINLNGAKNTTIKNVEFDAAKAQMSYDYKLTAKQYANIITGDKTNNSLKGAHGVVIDGCKFTGEFANGGASIAFTDYNRTSGFSGNITIKNCTFDTKNAYYNIYGHYCGNGTNGIGDFVIDNNTFNTTFTAGGAIYLGRYASSVPVVVSGNTFNVAKSLDEAMYVQDHSNYGVSINASNNTFAN